MTSSWLGALVGLTAAGGVVLVIARFRVTAPLTLRERITPYVPYLSSEQPDQRPSTLKTLQALLPAGRWGGNGTSSADSAAGLERVVAVSVGVGAGALLGFALALRGNSGLLVPLLAALGGVAADLLRSTLHNRSQRSISRRIGAELPDLAELLAFAVVAGESPPAAFNRVGEMASGDLGALMSRAAAEIRLGTPFEVAMRDFSSASGAPEVERFVDALLLAMERGTPLADVLRAQAADARAAQSRRLMESAGRKDVAMLIPVVFLILPTVVLIALFPGFRSLHLFIN